MGEQRSDQLKSKKNFLILLQGFELKLVQFRSYNCYVQESPLRCKYVNIHIHFLPTVYLGWINYPQKLPVNGVNDVRNDYINNLKLVYIIFYNGNSKSHHSSWTSDWVNS